MPRNSTSVTTTHCVRGPIKVANVYAWERNTRPTRHYRANPPIDGGVTRFEDPNDGTRCARHSPNWLSLLPLGPLFGEELLQDEAALVLQNAS